MAKQDKGLTAIVMMGGGARAAYQVGVLLGISKLMPKGAPSPFQVICGTSAGAINALALASMAGDYRHAVHRLYDVWANFRVRQVFRSDILGIAKTGARWLMAMILGGLGRNNPLYLFDRAPLHSLLTGKLDFSQVQVSIDQGHLHALSVSASGYSSGQSVTFFQGSNDISTWRRSRRVGCKQIITVDHLMASSAIPFLFEPVRLNREFFGDGSMRQIAPLSPALHLGAERVLIIGNRMESEDTIERTPQREHPSFAQIAGHALNSIFLDSLEADLERLQRVNKTLDYIDPSRITNGEVNLRKVDTLMISPEVDLGVLAHQYFHTLPASIRFLLRGMGASAKHGSALVSYLLFEKEYCRRLIRLGMRDALRQSDALIEFLGIE